MLNTANLSLEQAPPISIPFRFFLTAPLFGVVAGLFILAYGPGIITSRWLPATLALTHAITLGFLSMVMCGAMMQMLPVLTGSPVPKVKLVGSVLHVCLVVGTLALIFSFVTELDFLSWIAVASLVIGFSVFIAAIFIALFRVKVSTSTLIGMRLAGFSLLVTVILGLILFASLSGWVELSYQSVWLDSHLGWGLIGWVGLLLMSVSYQVVPMFHVTPEYPEWMRRGLAICLFVLLILWSISWIWISSGSFRNILLSLIFLGLLSFVVLTFRLFLQKKRKVTDVTLFFWRASLIGMVAATALWFYAEWLPAYTNPSIVVLLIGSLALSAAMAVINGMLYKIMPFLSWFHLQNRQLALMCFSVNIPHMKALQSDSAVFKAVLSVVVIRTAVFIRVDRG